MIASMIKRAMVVIASILASIVSFFLAFAFVQYFVSRNLPGEPSGIARLGLNFVVAGLTGGAVYATVCRRGDVRLAIIPSVSFGLLFAIGRISVGQGAEALPFAVPVLMGIGSGLLGAYVVRAMLPKL
jgi:hypothetical protein